MTNQQRWLNQFERCTRRPQFMIPEKPISGIEKQAIEDRENRLMHEEIDSFSVEAE